MRHLAPLVLLAPLVALSGCAGAGDATEPAERNPPVAVYVSEARPGAGVRLHGVLVPIGRVGPRAAVEALTTYTPATRYATLWNGTCAPGQGLDDVTVTDTLVTVHFNTSGTTQCDLSDNGVVTLEQQLAWTVAAATGRPKVPVVVTVRGDAHRALGPVVAQKKYVVASP